MNATFKYFSKFFLTFILLLGLIFKISPAVEATTLIPENSMMIKQQIILATDEDYCKFYSFVDNNIAKVSPDLAGAMVQQLIKISTTEINEANKYIYGQDYRKIQSTIVCALPQDLERLSIIHSNDKEKLIHNLPNNDIKTKLSTWLQLGFCLKNIEGTYFFAIDYPELLQKYAQYTDKATAEFLRLSANETIQPAIISEILTFDADELYTRAIAYERFLKDYPYFPLRDIILTKFYDLTSKLIYPTYFDKLITPQGQISSNLLLIYQKLALQEDCPILQNLAQNMLNFISEQPECIADKNYTDTKLLENASILSKQTHQLINDLYIEIP